MPKHALEAQLSALTQEFVLRLVDVIRHASFADVAALSTPKQSAGTSRLRRGPKPTSGGAAAKSNDVDKLRTRQTAAHRAELAERVVRMLQGAAKPLGMRALSNELSVPPDLLAVPLRELRASGRIQKHGEKRATTYSAA